MCPLLLTCTFAPCEYECSYSACEAKLDCCKETGAAVVTVVIFGALTKSSGLDVIIGTEEGAIAPYNEAAANVETGAAAATLLEELR